jgi:hypothetical protein
MRGAGLMAEFESPEAMKHAAATLYSKGFRRMDAYAPYPVEGMDEAMGIPRSPIPRWVLGIGMLGAVLTYFVQFWVNAVDYPIVVGGRPLFSVPALVPITFELGVLSASFAAFFGLLGYARLPRLWSPEFEVEGFERATVDRYFVAIDARDPCFDWVESARELERLGALRVAELEAP